MSFITSYSSPLDLGAEPLHDDGMTPCADLQLVFFDARREGGGAGLADLYCTRPTRHGGPHMAQVENGLVAATWGETE